MIYRRRISSDIDGTKLKSGGNQAFLLYLEEKGVKINKEVFAQTCDWLKGTNLTTPELSEYYACFHEEGRYISPGPMPGAVDTITQLANNHSIYIATSRGPRTAASTWRELRLHFGITYTDGVFGALHRKHEAIPKFGAFVHFEDCFEEAQRIAEEVYVILLPHPNNAHIQEVTGRLIPTQAQARCHREMTEPEWLNVWEAAWTEIPELCRDLWRRRNQQSAVVPILKTA